MTSVGNTGYFPGMEWTVGVPAANRGCEMSEQKHTPGPWSVYDYGEEEAPTLVIHKDSNTRVCFLATPGSHGDPARIEADAHLIAAAPDMLAELKRLHAKTGEQITADLIAKAEAQP